jgi:hypothetical protein
MENANAMVKTKSDPDCAYADESVGLGLGVSVGGSLSAKHSAGGFSKGLFIRGLSSITRRLRIGEMAHKILDIP